MQHKPLTSLGPSERLGPPRECFVTPEWYQRDVDAIFRPAWHVAAHSSELRDPGAFLTFALGDDELVIVRDENGTLQAFHNFCRHRGHRLCSVARGTVRKHLICPYHGWSYSSTDGSCRSAVKMHETFDPSAWSLVRAWVEEYRGLVFVCTDDTPPPTLTKAFDALGFGGYDLDHMKLAARRDYETRANWKVVVENGSECYHCALNHPELCKVYDPWDIDYVENIDAMDGNAVATVTGADVGARTLEDMTFTVDGQRVCAVPAPRLDEEASHARELWWQPGNALSLTRDSGFLFTLRPSGPNRTEQTQFWLVHEDAEEGKDYTLDHLMKLMVVTQDEDKGLCEEVQRGIEMRRYTPGPLNLHYQAGQIEFYRWYESRLLQFEQRTGLSRP